MVREPGAAGRWKASMLQLGPALLSLLAGIVLALLGWTAVRQLRATSLEDLVLDRAASRATWTVALVFRPKECPSRMELVERLNRLGGPHVRVQGILVVRPGEFTDWRDLIAANRITFPVRTASPTAALNALGRTPTPALVVYDGEGRLRLLTDLASSPLVSDILSQATALANRPPPEKGP